MNVRFRLRRPVALAFLSVAAALLAGRSADAHMAWLGSTPSGDVIFWFGESPAERTYHLPERLETIDVYQTGTKEPLDMSMVGTDDLVGLKSSSAADGKGEYYATATYGLYHGMKLTYHVEHLPQQDSSQWPSEIRTDAKLQTVLRSPTKDVVEVTVLVDGKPLAASGVKLHGAHGEIKASKETDESGKVVFEAKSMTNGLNAVVVGVNKKNVEGELDGEKYVSTADYLTSTFYFEGTDAAPQTVRKPQRPTEEESSIKVTVKPSGYPDLPEELTSFGAAYLDGKIYVYGGHTGAAHSYSIDEQSNRLWCLDLNTKEASWEELPGGPRLQGLALVPYGDSLIRIGGFTAMNETGEEHQLVSQTSVSKYDPAKKAWTDLPELPEPRSSFDAAVLGDKVYVIGGWKLDGTEDGQQWHQTAYSLDLSNPETGWQALKQPPFQRRALSVAAYDGKIYAVGGMRSKRGPTTEVSVYDTDADTWTEGPSLPGGGMSGFGSSSFACSDHLFVTSMDGGLHVLANDGKSWETLTKTDPARFFHRMIPVSKKEMLMIGGANMEIGKFTEVQTIEVAGVN
ncbi:Kelch repeat-containing protein [Roseiconus lacunae]|uniref:Kelch repeat-containing protein n=1 Tax=Roseiconus lacunae TaxID=2605694 RepID=UPI001E40FBAF|nr:hypothetical protein [Roseiconus lacunae]MCD0459418.1 hypothetical protein [Roseiconus lacunae]